MDEELKGVGLKSGAPRPLIFQYLGSHYGSFLDEKNFDMEPTGERRATTKINKPWVLGLKETSSF